MSLVVMMSLGVNLPLAHFLLVCMQLRSAGLHASIGVDPRHCDNCPLLNFLRPLPSTL